MITKTPKSSNYKNDILLFLEFESLLSQLRGRSTFSLELTIASCHNYSFAFNANTKMTVSHKKENQNDSKRNIFSTKIFNLLGRKSKFKALGVWRSEKKSNHFSHMFVGIEGLILGESRLCLNVQHLRICMVIEEVFRVWTYFILTPATKISTG